MVKVSGRIFLNDNDPVTGGMVVFISGTIQGKGNIAKDGTYTLSFLKKGDGIPPGTYQVLVTGAYFTPASLKTEDEMDSGTRPMIDSIYAETETSPLRCDVPNPDGYDFVVTPSEFYAKEKGIPLPPKGK